MSLRHGRGGRHRLLPRLSVACILIAQSACSTVPPKSEATSQHAASCNPPPPHADYTWLLFFGDGDFTLTERSRSTLASLARLWKQGDGVILKLYGHTDEAETRSASPSLDVDRALAAKQYLVEQQIDQQRIAVEGFGATRRLVLSDGAVPQNRRVEAVPVFDLSLRNQKLRTNRLICADWYRSHCSGPGSLTRADSASCDNALSAARPPSS